MSDMNKPFLLIVCAAFMVVLALAGGGCKSTYYGAMEMMGSHKRDILVDRVEDARDDQEAAKEQFKSALEKFQSVVSVPESELKKTYETLNTELERSEKRATAVSDRIASIESVAKDLFREWEKELDQYSNADLRRSSEKKLDETKARYEDLIGAMKKAEGKMEPVLTAFRDHVLFLKHNLNAQAVASLQGEVTNLESEIGALVRDMEAAIAEADSFIKQMQAGES
jgi:DNA repair exonuclease SbcCD ATPase subunit